MTTFRGLQYESILNKAQEVLWRKEAPSQIEYNEIIRLLIGAIVNLQKPIGEDEIPEEKEQKNEEKENQKPAFSPVRGQARIF